MAWQTPTNFTAGVVVTEADLDALSGDLNETMVAKVSAAGDMAYATAANALTRLAKGTSGQVLNFDAASTAPAWTSTISLSSVTAAIFTASSSSNAFNYISTVGAGTAAKTLLSINSAGSNYGTVMSTTAGGGGAYALGYSASLSTTPGTAVLTWTGAGGVQIGAPTGGDKGAGTLNTAGDIYKNNSSYNNPDYVLEMWARGKIRKYADNPGAADYPGVLPLKTVEEYAREHMRLPRLENRQGIFDRADIVLEKLEEIFIHLFDIDRRLTELEAR